MQDTQTDKLIKALEKGPKRTSELGVLGISRMTIKRKVEQNKILRLSRGLYALPDSPVSEHQSLIEACKKVPKGVVCLLSALRYYDLTTEAPYEVWVAIKRGRWKPDLDYPTLRVMTFSGQAFTEGIDNIELSGGNICIYKPAKTVADCFKFRNKIGQHIAIAALKECWQKRLATINDLHHYAKVCRVANVMKPYMETLT